MGLHEEFDTRLKDAMRAKDTRVLDVVRIIRSRAKKSAIMDNKELNDELYQETILGYVKQMKRAQKDYEAAGEQGAEMADKLRFEVEYLEPLLPQQMSEDQVKAIVKEAIAAHGISNPRQAGRVVGLVLKNHKGLVEPALVKKLADEELAP